MKQNGKKGAGSVPLLIKKRDNISSIATQSIDIQCVIFLNEKYGIFAGSKW